MLEEVSIRIAGLTGLGVEFTTEVIVDACAKRGLHVYTYRFFPTIVRGGYTFSDIRISCRKTSSPPDEINILGALSKEGLRDVDKILSKDALIIIDEEVDVSQSVCKHVIQIPIGKLSRELKTRMNMILLGFLSGLLNLNFEVVTEILRKKKISEFESNLRGLKKGIRIFEESGLEKIVVKSYGGVKSVIRGSDLVALGALYAGCKFFAGYPITPATSIMEALMNWIPELGGVAVQVEDELAAINMVIGASYAGARAMTVTSGPGFSLMAEGIGFAGMAGIPVVIVDVQRVGPSTGLPTAHEQSDIDIATHPSHGDVPRIVLAPSTIEEYYTFTVKSFQLSEKYRAPVILLLDQSYTLNYQTIDKIRNPEVYSYRVSIESSGDSIEVYPYYDSEWVPSPPSKRLLIVASSVEHDYRGFSVQDGEIHASMSDKRLGKLRELEENPVDWEVVGDVDGREVFITIGCCRAAVEEACSRLSKNGRRFKHIPLKQLWPIPRKLREELREAEVVYVVEQNASGQVLRLISKEIPENCIVKSVRRYDGQPLRSRDIVEVLRDGSG